MWGKGRAWDTMKKGFSSFSKTSAIDLKIKKKMVMGSPECRWHFHPQERERIEGM